MDRQPFQKRFTAMQQEYESSWRTRHEEIQRFIKPTRGFFNGSQPNRGDVVNHKDFVDGTPARAARDLAAGMFSGLSSPSRPWFKLGVSDPELSEYEPVKEYLNFVQLMIMDIFAKSNIYDTLYNIYEDLGPFGTGCAIILDDYEDVIRGRSFTAGEYYLGLGHDCRVNAFGRQYWMTVDRMVGGLLVLPATADTVAGFLAAAEAAPDSVSTIANVMNCPPMTFVPEEYHVTVVILAIVCHAGGGEAGERAI
jgi:hypothetical protein